MLTNSLECKNSKAQGRVSILLSGHFPDLGSAQREPDRTGKIQCPECDYWNPFSFRELVPREPEMLESQEHRAKVRRVDFVPLD
jgi:hypothetical protein